MSNPQDQNAIAQIKEAHRQEITHLNELHAQAIDALHGEYFKCIEIALKMAIDALENKPQTAGDKTAQEEQARDLDTRLHAANKKIPASFITKRLLQTGKIQEGDKPKQ